MILANVECIRCGHFKNIFVKPRAAETGLRLCTGRLQKAEIADALRPPIEFDLVSMDLDDLSESRKERFGDQIIPPMLLRSSHAGD